jgi:hypothetical protein
MLTIGDTIPHYGKLIAIANGHSYGERYYFLKDKHGSISMMPASVIESEMKQ